MEDICYFCDGTGERDFLSGATCHVCHGSGWIPDAEEPDESLRVCPRCKQSVYIRDDSTICDDCWFESTGQDY